MLEGSKPSGTRRRWRTAGLVALAIAAATSMLVSRRRDASDRTTTPDAPARFVGSVACRECHQEQFVAWKGSHHERAMDVATDATVLGDFDDARFEHGGVETRFYRRDGRFLIETEGPGGQRGEFEVTHVFGLDPLQQYLIPFPGGRMQAFSVAWDAREKRWYYLYPGREIPASDWLHWTRNGQNWNGMCAECHSTNLQKAYDPTTDTYATSWSEINVGCEACHGPGSRHVTWATQPNGDLADLGLLVRTRGIPSQHEVELCAPCHARRAEIGDDDHSGQPLLDHALPSLLDEGLYHADGQQQDEVYMYASFLQSRMYAEDVRCSDCHDSHSGRLLREGNELCLKCHEAPLYDTEEHHFHQKSVAGHASDGALCAKCHMLEQLYMVIDWRADHSFRVPRPDLSVSIGTPNACGQSGCHSEQPAEWAAEAVRGWYGNERPEHFGPAFAAGRRGEPDAEDGLARLVHDDSRAVIVRASALSLLDAYPGPARASAIETGLGSGEPLLRHVAATGLARDDDGRRLALLTPLLSDPLKALRLDAIAGLASMPRDRLTPEQQRAFDAARREYETAMAYSLDFASSAHNLGNLHASLGDPAAAEREYRRALEIDDLFLPAQMNLAVLLSAGGRPAEAATLLRQAAAAYPDNGEVAYSLGLVLVETGKAEEAVTHLELAVEREPRHLRAHYNLGLLQQQLGRRDAAERSLTRALALEPSDFDVTFALADHYLRRGRPADALALAQRMIELRPDERAGHQIAAAARQAIGGRD